MQKSGQTRVEWALLGIIAIVCAGLSFLQYRWTGELRRAELLRLRSGLNEQLQHLARAFDSEIHENCGLLLPSPHELGTEGAANAHRLRYEQWTASHDRSLFARIGIAVPQRGTLALYSLDAAGRMAPMQWPSSWESLQAQMTARIHGDGPPPYAPPNSALIEIPVLEAAAGGPHNPGPELEWMIFELNEDYMRGKVLPGIIAEYLNSDAAVSYDASVSWAPAGAVIFSTRADGVSVAPGADATAGLFSPAAGGLPGRHRGRREDVGPPRWEIAVRHHAGSLDAAVSSARTRNLVTSLLLIGLLGGAAWALVRFTARSRRLSEMQFRFAAGVSHDLRTPLTAIRGAAFNLVDGLVKEPAAVSRYAKLILRNAEELTSMIENVLAFSASLRSGTAVRRETFAVGDLLHHAASVMAQEIEDAGCRIEVDVAPDLPPVDGDPVALELAFRNLIGNAIRHGAEGRWIGVSARRSGDCVEVHVCDRGPGVAERERDRIFEPFYRGEQSRAQRIQGTGLGLSLVKNTVERHHGSVAVQNSAGGGAEFTLRLPASAEAV